MQISLPPCPAVRAGALCRRNARQKAEEPLLNLCSALYPPQPEREVLHSHVHRGHVAEGHHRRPDPRRHVREAAAGAAPLARGRVAGGRLSCRRLAPSSEIPTSALLAVPPQVTARPTALWPFLINKAVLKLLNAYKARAAGRPLPSHFKSHWRSQQLFQAGLS